MSWSLSRPGTSAWFRETFASLSSKNCRHVFASDLAAMLGSALGTFASQWILADHLGGGLNLGVLAASMLLPRLFGGLLSGPLVDRIPRRRLMMVAQVVFALQAAVLVLLAMDGTLVPRVLYVTGLISGLVYAVVGPADESFVGELVGPERIPNTVGLRTVAMGAGALIAALTFGVIVSWWGAPACLAINALGCALSFVALATIDTASLRRLGVDAPSGAGLRQAWAWVGGTPACCMLLLAAAILSGLAFQFWVWLPLAATDGGGAAAFSAFQTALSIGAIVGALRAARVRRMLVAMIASSAGLALCGLACAATTGWWLVVPLAVTGALSVANAAALVAYLQVTAPVELRDRVMAIFALVPAISGFAGALALGAVADALGARSVPAIGAVGALLAAIALALAHTAERRSDR